MRTSSLFFQFIALVSALLLTCCDRAKKLQEERQKVDKYAERIHSETQLLEQRALALGAESASVTLTIQRQTSMFEQKMSNLQAEIDALKAKLKTLENATAALGPKVDAYKAKHLR